MKNAALTQTLHVPETNSLQENIIHFYDQASMDYAHWSKDLNMHFGYFRWGKTNPLRRDSMLNEMNAQVYNRLQLTNTIQRVADLGCGMGGSMRYMLRKNPKLFMFGVTMSPYQVGIGNRLLKNHNGIICQENYEDTSLQTESLDGAVAIESLCHLAHSKESLREAYRILKPKTRFVVADCFLKKEADKLCFGSKLCYKRLCDDWKLAGIGTITRVIEDLKKIGFSEVIVEDISMRVAPSVLHAPFAIVTFLLQNIFRRKVTRKESQNNLKASFFSLIAGLHRRAFGYYILTAIK